MLCCVAGRGGRRTLIASVALRTSRIARHERRSPYSSLFVLCISPQRTTTHRLADQKGADGGDDITNAMVVIDLSNGSQANGSKQVRRCDSTNVSVAHRMNEQLSRLRFVRFCVCCSLCLFSMFVSFRASLAYFLLGIGRAARRNVWRNRCERRECCCCC